MKKLTFRIQNMNHISPDQMFNTFILRKNINEAKYDIYRYKVIFFTVSVSQQNISIMGYDNTGHQKLNILIKIFEGFWYSQDPFRSSGTLLIKVSTYDYVHVGFTIYKFKTSETSIGYISPTNDIRLYPILLATNN